MTTMTAVLLTAVALGGEPQGVVYDFYSDSCMPCQQMHPIVSKLQRQGYAIQKINIEKHPEMATRFNVNLLPTFVLAVNGKEVRRIVGATSESQLRRMAMQIPTGSAADNRTESHLVRTSGRGERLTIAMGTSGLERPSLGAPIRFQKNQPQRKGTASLRQPERRVPSDIASRSRFPKLPSSAPIIRAKREEQPAVITPLRSSLLMQDPMAASVRIRMKDGRITDYGTGTIIESRLGRTIILTCGHIIRDASRDAKFEVDLFLNGKTKTVVASVLKANYDADVGLLTIPTDSALPFTHVAEAGSQSQAGDAVLSIGCSSGQDPTRENLKITAINPYQGPDTIECSGLPVPGRSGGGLFNVKNEIIGICMAANEKDKRGLYCGLKPIHALLREAKLSHLVRSPAPPAQLASNQNRLQPLSRLETISFGQSAPEPAKQPFPIAQNQIQNQNGVSEQELAEMRAILRSAKGAKLTILIEDPNSPHGTRVVIIPQASAKFLADLTGETSRSIAPQDRMMTQKLNLNSSRYVKAARQDRLSPSSLREKTAFTPERYRRTK